MNDATNSLKSGSRSITTPDGALSQHFDGRNTLRWLDVTPKRDLVGLIVQWVARDDEPHRSTTVFTRHVTILPADVSANDSALAGQGLQRQAREGHHDPQARPQGQWPEPGPTDVAQPGG